MIDKAKIIPLIPKELENQFLKDIISELEILIIQNKNDLDKGNGVKLLNIYIEGLRQKIEK